MSYNVKCLLDGDTWRHTWRCPSPLLFLRVLIDNMFFRFTMLSLIRVEFRIVPCRFVPFRALLFSPRLCTQGIEEKEKDGYVVKLVPATYEQIMAAFIDHVSPGGRSGEGW